ncbi:predicted protein [Thalassiosira pseudonana CCMP1335]|uniref:Uncharacterized protein n=1 Tax=Thalassiosira pseudonana TaxID=35128 RepID=B8C7C4_THAPS|nr:predicted protein [Thalassiosira pseudonana CCMP1335]EED90953.1 predicted protein [Thalassiosira pseudonana CCMP1335]
MVNGPKRILSSAIANALGEYFDVDAKSIEANLIKDARIVLKHVALKKQTSCVPINSVGNSTVITVTGSVEEVSFTWAWSVGGSDQQWIRDAVLTITGAKFACHLEHDEVHDADATKITDDKHRDSLSDFSFVNPAKIDADAQKEIKKEPGGIVGYVARQVKMVIDMLTLKMVGFELRIVLPPSLVPEDKNVELSDGSRSIVIGADELELLSLGRDDAPSTSDVTMSVLQQRLSLRSFVTSIVLNDNDESTIEHPILEPFSYCTDVKRVGERFGGFLTGLDVKGVVESVQSIADSLRSTSGLTLHLGNVQTETIMQLGMLVLPPPSKSVESERYASSKSSTTVTDSVSISDSSSFTFPLPSVSLVLYEDTRFVVTDIIMRYKADGSVCSIEASKMKYTTLSKPVQGTEISYEGDVLMVRVDDEVDVMVLIKNDVDNDATSARQTNATAIPPAPCPIDMAINMIAVRKDADGSSMKLKSLKLYANPAHDSTQVAIQFDDFKNQMLSLSKANICASVPVKEMNTINDFTFSVDKAEVKSGYSTNDWTSEFRPTHKHVTLSATSPTPIVKMPKANIASMRVQITWAGTGVKIKDTSLTIKAFKGKADTSSKDLINYYTTACLSRVPDFISNAEVLGLNVVDSTALNLGTWFGLATPFGAGGGIAAVTAVDVVKGAVNAGKRNRKVDESAGYRPGDFLRGVFYAAGEATRDGAIKRGKNVDEGNLIDWAVGATSGTSNYISDNKVKLGGATSGGVGFLYGMVLGGPVGAVVGE